MHNWIVYNPPIPEAIEIYNPPDPTVLDKLVSPIAYLLVAYWLSLPVIFLVAAIRGKRITWDLSWRFQKWPVILGFLILLATIFYIYAFALQPDPSVIIPLTAVSIVYLGVYEAIKGIVAFRDIALPAVLVVVGTGLTAFKGWDKAEGLQISWEVIVLVAVVSEFFITIADLVSVRIPQTISVTDQVFWRLLWSAIFITGISVAVGLPTNYFLPLISAWWHSGFVIAIIFLLLRLLLLAFSLEWNQIARQRSDEVTYGEPGSTALRQAKSASRVKVLTSVKVGLGVPITLVVYFICLYVFSFKCLGGISEDIRIWLVRFGAAILIFIGAALLILRREAVARPVVQPEEEP